MMVFLSLMVLAFAFAELVDNALAATADNEGPRKIEIRLVCVWNIKLVPSISPLPFHAGYF